MIKVKHLLEPIEGDDGKRLWIEPIGLTKDLCQWCSVNFVLPHLGPPVALWEWFQEHPEAYEYFRGNYHQMLSRSPYRQALRDLSCAGAHENFTLLHQEDDPEHNTATALYEFLSELSTYCPPEP